MNEIMTYLIIGVIIMMIAFLKIRSMIINNKITAVSDNIKRINDLNKETLFHDVDEDFFIQKHYDNKSHYLKIQPGYLMSSYIKDDIEYMSKYISKIKDNRNTYEVYKEKIRSIYHIPSDEFHLRLKISRKAYIKRELKLFKSKIIKPVLNCMFTVKMSYSSPKGQVNLSKEECFDFDDMFTSYESISRKNLDKNTLNILRTVERGEVSDSLRFDVLARDGYKCTICGATANLGARLHVDHIIPIAKGGRSVIENLQTLCERCNIGKSDKINLVDNNEKAIDNIPSCPKCKSAMTLRQGPSGKFYGCSNYPSCKMTSPFN